MTDYELGLILLRVATIFVTGGMGIIAWIALHRWRKESIGKEQMKLSQEILDKIYLLEGTTNLIFYLLKSEINELKDLENLIKELREDVSNSLKEFSSINKNQVSLYLGEIALSKHLEIEIKSRDFLRKIRQSKEILCKKFVEENIEPDFYSLQKKTNSLQIILKRHLKGIDYKYSKQEIKDFKKLSNNLEKKFDNPSIES